MNWYYQLLVQSFKHPKQLFIKNSKLNYRWALGYFLINLCLAQLIYYIVICFTAHSFIMPFVAINQLLLALPAIFGLYLTTVVVLWLFSKGLSGSASFELTFTTVALVSAPILLSGIPYLNIAARIYQFGLLVLGFAQINHYGYVKAIINILIPTLVLALLTTLLVVR